jgi:hypothetical protein
MDTRSKDTEQGGKVMLAFQKQGLALDFRAGRVVLPAAEATIQRGGQGIARPAGI